MSADSGTEIGDADPEDLPSADIEVDAHVHFAMAGSFPLRIAELFFTPVGLYIAEYSYITPLFGLGTRKHRKDADAMRALFEKYGIDAVLLHADRVIWLGYGSVDRIVLHSGGRFGRPKVTVYAADGPSYAYRLFGGEGFEPVVDDVTATAEEYDLDVAVEDRWGFKPRENVARFFDRE